MPKKEKKSSDSKSIHSQKLTSSPLPNIEDVSVKKLLIIIMIYCMFQALDQLPVSEKVGDEVLNVSNKLRLSLMVLVGLNLFNELLIRPNRNAKFSVVDTEDAHDENPAFEFKKK
ncbi:MAG TPA: hypothetical protein VHE99_11900 [Gammaproteobacteria bacterium]|nr:hypothetical protein [Gammaproteobacteria bacterium]